MTAGRGFTWNINTSLVFWFLKAVIKFENWRLLQIIGINWRSPDKHECAGWCRPWLASTYAYSLPASVVCWYLLQAVWDQARQNVWLDLDPNCLTLWSYSWKIFFWKSWFWKKSADAKQHAQYPSMQRLNGILFCIGAHIYSKTRLKRPFKNRQNKGLKDK